MRLRWPLIDADDFLPVVGCLVEGLEQEPCQAPCEIGHDEDGDEDEEQVEGEEMVQLHRNHLELHQVDFQAQAANHPDDDIGDRGTIDTLCPFGTKNLVEIV